MKIVLITFGLLYTTLANQLSAEPLELVLAEAFEGACGPEEKYKDEPKKYYKKPKYPKHPKHPKTKK